jgi:hypothetical protein
MVSPSKTRAGLSKYVTGCAMLTLHQASQQPIHSHIFFEEIIYRSLDCCNLPLAPHISKSGRLLRRKGLI